MEPKVAPLWVSSTSININIIIKQTQYTQINLTLNLKILFPYSRFSKIKQVVARYCGAQPEGTAESEGRGHCTRAHGLLGSREGVEAEVEDVRKPDGGLEGEDNGGDMVVQADRGNLQLQKSNDQSPLAAAVPDSGIERPAGS